jgi:hypothetical protein
MDQDLMAVVVERTLRQSLTNLNLMRLVKIQTLDFQLRTLHKMVHKEQRLD